ncbi:MAG: DUF6378 domain-containing protein [Geminicoccaceae bacterium]
MCDERRGDAPACGGHPGRPRQDAREAMATIAARWSLTLGHPVTPEQVVLCMIDLKLARLRRDPAHQDSMVDLIGYATVLHEVSR